MRKWVRTLQLLSTHLKNCLKTFPNPTLSLMASASEMEFELPLKFAGPSWRLQFISTLVELSLAIVLKLASGQGLADKKIEKSKFGILCFRHSFRLNLKHMLQNMFQWIIHYFNSTSGLNARKPRNQVWIRQKKLRSDATLTIKK